MIDSDLLARIRFRPGCWEWTGAVATTGYGVARSKGRRRYAHRLVWELLVGPIPDGTEIDHTRRNTLCVNPMHPEPVPHAENIRRGTSPAAVNARKTACRRGHPYDAANTDVRPDGKGRACRACWAERRRSGGGGRAA